MKLLYVLTWRAWFVFCMSTFLLLMIVWNWENDRKDVAWKRTFKKTQLFFPWSSSSELDSKDWLNSDTDINWFRALFQFAHSKQKNQTKPNQLHVQRADLREVSGVLLSFFQQYLLKFFPQSWISPLSFIFQRKGPENNTAHELWSEVMWFPSSSVATPMGWDLKLLCCFLSPKVPGG